MKVLYIAPIKKGGPHLSLKKLNDELKNKKNIETKFYASLKGFIYAIFAKKYDIIHTILPIPFNIWRTPIILNIRGNYKIERGFRNPLGYLYPISIKFASKIISPSKFMVNKLNLKNVQIIPNFVNKNLFLIENEYLKSKKINICLVTKFHFYEKAKGVLDILDILNSLKINKQIELNILGTGTYLDEIKKKAKVNSNITINWKGFIDNPYEFISKQDIHTYWSNLDNFPNSVLESMALGVPTITNDVGAVSEFIENGKSGFVCKNKDEYIKVLRKLIDDSVLKKKIGVCGRKHVRDKFSIDFVSSEFLRVYQKVYKKYAGKYT